MFLRKSFDSNGKAVATEHKNKAISWPSKEPTRNTIRRRSKHSEASD